MVQAHTVAYSGVSFVVANIVINTIVPQQRLYAGAKDRCKLAALALFSFRLGLKYNTSLLSLCNVVSVVLPWCEHKRLLIVSSIAGIVHC